MKWKEYSLDELIHIKHGYAFKGEFFSEEPTADILLTPGNFAIGGGFKAQKLKYYNGDFPVDYILDENDVIVTMTDLSKEADTLGFSAKVPAWFGKRFLHNQRIGLVKLKTDDFDQEYLYWLMRTFSYQRFVANGATGATVKHTSPTKICQYKFTAPVDKNTQRKIASILSAYDDLIENNLKRIKLLEEKAQLHYKELMQDSSKWDKVRLEEFVSVVKGRKPANVLEQPEEESQLYLLLDTVERGKTLYTTDLSLPQSVITDVLMCMDGARSGLSFRGMVGAIGSTMAIWRSNSERVSGEFLYQFMKQNESAIKQGNTGAAIPHANRKFILDMKMAIPPKKEAENFDGLTLPMIKLINTLHNQNTKLREARDILLPKLMNGEIEV